MSSLTKGLILVVAILAIGAGLAVWKKKAGSGHGTESFNSISRPEIETLIAGVRSPVEGVAQPSNALSGRCLGRRVAESG